MKKTSLGGKKKILVVGGGIAGVTLATLLQDKYEVVLIEKGDRWRTIGFGIGMWKSGIDVLKKLPIDKKLFEKMHMIKSGGWLDANGNTVTELDFVKIDSTYGAAAFSVKREDLHQALHETIGKKVDVRFNTNFRNIVSRGNRVAVTFDNGKKDVFDLVVGADGVRSMVREKIFGVKATRYNWSVIGGWSSERSSHYPGYHILAGTKEFLLGFPCDKRYSSGLIYWDPSDEYIETPTDKGSILKHFRHTKSSMKRVVDGIDFKGGFYCDKLMHVEMKDWFKGRVTLIGDARHGFSPVSGFGTTLALEDAYVLARELNKNENIDSALATFQRLRKRRLRTVKHLAQILESLVMINSKPKNIFRYSLVKMMPNAYPEYLFRKIFAQNVLD